MWAKQLPIFKSILQGLVSLFSAEILTLAFVEKVLIKYMLKEKKTKQ